MSTIIKNLTNKAKTEIIYPITVAEAVILNESTSLLDALNTKVDKALGKQLSQENYTTIEKSKLYSIENGAQVNQNTFSRVAVAGSGDIVADQQQDTLNFVAGTNIVLSTAPNSDSVIISATGTVAIAASNTSIVDAADYYISTDVEGALQEVGYTLAHISTEASNIPLQDTGSYYAVDNVEDALQQVGGDLLLKASSQYPSFSGNILLDSSNQYAEIKVVSTHPSAFSMLKLQDVDNTGYDLTYDKVNGSFAINKTVGGAYSSSPLVLTTEVFNYNNNTVWHAGNDGSGSGLDADTLDGNHASTFATQTQLNTKASFANAPQAGEVFYSGGGSNVLQNLALGTSGQVLTVGTGKPTWSTLNIPTTSSILQAVYPVGSIYISTSSTNPATLFGFGTWTAFAAGRTLIGVGTSDQAFTAGATGGASTHTLTEAQIPSHNHVFPYNDLIRWVSPNGDRVLSSGNNVAGTGAATLYTNATGGSGAHNNLQPYIVTYMWQRTA